MTSAGPSTDPAPGASARPIVRRRTRTPSFEDILTAAAGLFQAQGFRNVSMQDVADHLSITKPTLYVHASTKAKILEGIFDTVIAEGEAALRAASTETTPEDQVRVLLTRWTYAATNRQAFYQVCAAHLPDLSPAAARSYMRWSAGVIDRVRTMIVSGQRAGTVRPDLDPTVVAFSVVAVPNWTARWFTAAGQLTPAEVIDHQWRLILGGLTA